MKNGIAVAGTILVDEINEISAYPKSGELTKILKVGKSVGGCVPNVSVALKRIRPDIPVKVLGRIGNDDNGNYLKNTFTKNGVDFSNMVVGETPTSFTQVISVTGGERTFFTYAGANNDFSASDVDAENLGVKMFHLGYLLLIEKIDNGEGVELLKAVKKAGIKTSIDLVTENSNRYSKALPCLPYVDNIIINEIEAGALVNVKPTNDNLTQIARKIKALGVSERVIIHSPALAVCVSNDGETTLPSFDFPSELIVGTTGAGDAFCAGALIAIYQEKSDAQILEFAQSSAVCSLTAVDATSGVREESQIIEFCKNFRRK